MENLVNKKDAYGTAVYCARLATEEELRKPRMKNESVEVIDVDLTSVESIENYLEKLKSKPNGLKVGYYDPEFFEYYDVIDIHFFLMRPETPEEVDARIKNVQFLRAD